MNHPRILNAISSANPLRTFCGRVSFGSVCRFAFGSVSRFAFSSVTWLACTFVGLVGCVSVNVGPQKPEIAKHVGISEPKAPFKKTKIEGFDRSWKSDSTGNSLGYISECNASDASLNQLELDALSVLQTSRVQKTQELEFNGRGARESWVEGTVDGVKISMVILVFKKNGCQYTLSMVGPQSKFAQEVSAFQEFKAGFVVP